MVLIPKLRSLPRKKVLEILNNNNFKLVREGGRHSIYRKIGETGKVWTIFIGRHSEIIPPKIQSIIRQTGKKREEFH